MHILLADEENKIHDRPTRITARRERRNGDKVRTQLGGNVHSASRRHVSHNLLEGNEDAKQPSPAILLVGDTVAPPT